MVYLFYRNLITAWCSTQGVFLAESTMILIKIKLPSHRRWLNEYTYYDRAMQNLDLSATYIRSQTLNLQYNTQNYKYAKPCWSHQLSICLFEQMTHRVVTWCHNHLWTAHTALPVNTEEGCDIIRLPISQQHTHMHTCQYVLYVGSRVI